MRVSVLWSVVIAVGDLIVLLLPMVLLNTAKRGEGRVFRNLNTMLRSSMTFSAFIGLFMGMLAAIAGVAAFTVLINYLGLETIVVLALGLVFGIGLLWLIGWAVRLAVGHRVQRRQNAAFKRQLDREPFSLEALRRCVFDARTPYAVNAILVEMHRRDVRLPGEVVTFLDDLAIALEKGDHDLVDLPQQVRKREWVASPEVLDQLCILVSAQRKKAEATPR